MAEALDFTDCAALVERGDPVRFRAAMAAPVAARAVLFPLYAFNLEVARAPWVTAEPMIARMRLQWWRDALEEIAAGGVIRRHEVVTPLALAIRAEDVPVLLRLIDARDRDVEGEAFVDAAALWSYLEATAGGLIEVAARRLCLAKDKRFRAAEAAAAQQGGRPQRSRMPRWTAEEIAALRRLYPENDNLTVARELGRSVTSVANKAYQLGIKKSARLLTDIGRNNVALRYRGADRAEELPRDLPEGGRRRQAGDGADAAGDGPPSSLATGG